MKNTARSFIVYFFITLVVTCVVALILSLSHGLLNLDEFSRISGVLQGTLGIAVAFAGAFVAIRIAQLGTTIVSREKNRDDFLQVNEVIYKSIRPYRLLSNALNRVLDAQQSYQQLIAARYFKELDIPSSPLVHMEEVDFIQNYTSEMIEAFSLLEKSIHEILDNPYSYQLWISSTKDIDENRFMLPEAYSKLQYYNTRGLTPKRNLLELSLAISKRVKTTSIYGIPYEEVVQSHYFMHFIYPQGVREDYQNKSYEIKEKYYSAEAFFEIGANFWSDRLKDEGLFINVGGAMLHDLIIALPTTSTLTQELTKMLQHYFDIDFRTTPLLRLMANMEDSYLLSNSLLGTKEVFVEHQLNSIIRKENNKMP